MPMTPGVNTSELVRPSDTDGALVPATAADRPQSNLATLLDRFTAAVTTPESETIGSFAATVDALHGELAMLARHFGADVEAAQEAIDLDAIFPDTPDAADYAGVAEAEELEHLCRELSRS